MQTRPYDSKDGLRIWLSRDEREQLLDVVEDEPRRHLAFALGLHGLRTDEVLQVEPRHVRTLDGGKHVLRIPDGKSGRRETPLDGDLSQRIGYLKSAARLRQDEPLLDVAKRTVRTWMEQARDDLDSDRDGRWDAVGMHDLRRSWATDVYYSLAFAGVPIAEQLTMSWGGWKQTQKGRETFRQNYLGPVPDHVTARAFEYLPL